MGGNTDIDAPVATDLPPATGGTTADAKAPDGAGGSTGTGSDAKDSKIADTKVPDAGGATGQDAGIADARDATVDSADAPVDVCVLCTIGTTLIHRYNFDGKNDSTTLTDLVGGAAGNGAVIGTFLSGSGTLALTGGSDQYAELPKKILSPLTSATLEFWVTWNGGDNNQRIMDFGNNVQDGSNYRAISTVIISPNSTPSAGEAARLRASFCKDTAVANSSVYADAPNNSLLPTGTQQQIVVVFDGTNHTLAMYLNGVLQGQTAWTDALASITDTNAYLGHSQYSNDPGFNGAYHEVRIYREPLTAAQVKAVFAAGTEASFTQ
jgi:hypothetical protein